MEGEGSVAIEDYNLPGMSSTIWDFEQFSSFDSYEIWHLYLTFALSQQNVEGKRCLSK